MQTTSKIRRENRSYNISMPNAGKGTIYKITLQIVFDYAVTCARK